jgi:adenylate cyclase
MKSILRRRIRIASIGALVGAGFGTAYVAAIIGRTPSLLARGALTGALIASGLALIEILGAATRGGRLLRRLPFAAFVAARTAIWVAWTTAVLLFVPFVLQVSSANAAEGFARGIAYSVVVSLLFVALLELSRLLGSGTMWKLVTGRYHHPRIEERAFLLLDLVGSTAVAERIGDARFLAFLDRLICDIGEDISAHDGEIYRYVGDATIVSWPIDRAIADAAIVRCLFAVAGRISRQRYTYQREFGVGPAVRAALHAGPIAVGEVGDSRREITFLGDTLNTAARIEKVCGDLGRNAVISGSLLNRLSLPPGIRADPLGEIALAGKLRPVELYALVAATDATAEAGPAQALVE